MTYTDLPFIQIFFLKFSEIQITRHKVKIFLALNLLEISIYKSASNSDSFLYIQIFPHIYSDFLSDQSGRSAYTFNCACNWRGKGMRSWPWLCAGWIALPDKRFESLRSWGDIYIPVPVTGEGERWWCWWSGHSWVAL